MEDYGDIDSLYVASYEILPGRWRIYLISGHWYFERSNGLFYKIDNFEFKDTGVIFTSHTQTIFKIKRGKDFSEDNLDE
jgi:hypothetical protein